MLCFAIFKIYNNPTDPFLQNNESFGNCPELHTLEYRVRVAAELLQVALTRGFKRLEISLPSSALAISLGLRIISGRSFGVVCTLLGSE